MDLVPTRRQKRVLAFLHRRWKLLTLLLLVTVVPLIVAAAYGDSVASHYVYRALDQVPPRRVALVLGTAKYAPSGNVNRFYIRRIQAVLDLYETGVVTRILASGGYDEPAHMMKDLVALGVPEKHIECDSGGMRTFDSVIRAKEIFQLDGFVAVTQEFHCLRAVYLAREAELDVVGYCAEDVGGATGLRIRVREFAARAQAVLDTLVLGVQSRHFGEPREIG
ncbi:MAG: YdcF family protein [Planctomycetes bacterium]|nr:YdcF family protein [Planctomycetota bacterium]